MEKPILLWDRSECHEITCTCHDDSSTPRFCSACGCNRMSNGHRGTLSLYDAQAKRVRELEGALRDLASYGERAKFDASTCDPAYWREDIAHARRILEGGKP